MLNEERIEELTKLMKQGNEAEALLTDNKKLIEQKEQLERIKGLCNKCRKITIEYDYSRYVEFKVSMSSFAISQIDKVLDNEIELIDIKLKDLK